MFGIHRKNKTKGAALPDEMITVDAEIASVTTQIHDKSDENEEYSVAAAAENARKVGGLFNTKSGESDGDERCRSRDYPGQR